MGPVYPVCDDLLPQASQSTSNFETWCEREYIYTPSGASVTGNDLDHFILQIDRAGDPLYMLQDAELNVVGLIGWQFQRQDMYSPYGEIAATDYFYTTAGDNRVGHHGMFVDRLTTDPTEPQLAAGAPSLYRYRNRTYSPSLGRLLQRDPNASGVPTLSALAYMGRTWTFDDPSFDAMTHYGDGMSLFQSVNDNPINNSDPLGLSSWDDHETEDLIDDVIGHRLYVIGALNEGLQWASLGLNTALEIGGALLGIDMFESVQVLSSGMGGFAESVDYVMHAGGIGRLFGIAGKLHKAFHYQRLASRTGEIVKGSKKWLNEGPKEWGVYVARKNGKSVYVGSSNNVTRRAPEHGKRFDRVDEITRGGLTKHQSRAIEQLIKQRNDKFQNKINAINPSAKHYKDAIAWAEDYVREHGIKTLYGGKA